ncbi:ParE toxin of type II toxin-antitoxin system, parDE [Rhodospirillales bacterium URHD0017]|nr:ParE toxin of type II toxin-antitoxin system, parDE [Rhodospirillales bacterium URHD0017]
MAKLIVSPQAELDTATIVAMLTDTAGTSVAERYRRDFEELFERFTKFPTSGSPRRSLSRYARIGVVAPYVVIYEHRGETVRIVRVLDGRRNITRKLVRE